MVRCTSKLRLSWLDRTLVELSGVMTDSGRSHHLAVALTVVYLIFEELISHVRGDHSRTIKQERKQCSSESVVFLSDGLVGRLDRIMNQRELTYFLRRDPTLSHDARLSIHDMRI